MLGQMVDLWNFTILFYAIIWLIQALIMAGVCYWLAGEKGRDKTSWAMLGILLGLVAVIIIGFSPTKK